ncbi:hypothetical protein JCM10914A_11740 [Paenibacillus sp. JCM 10914]|uniref:nucleotidyltransferase-like protein n=1 Tax=Paenibacillus sp. JCM 10914 TaxID=1236974 RepID=UPI0003CCB8EF|nr:nucleotidyltransferase-like protein [Paenibacillus sp. JCM 10914]GAE09952.1 hypothetical protein JCM10914_6346 [Paenibacillus sp. JCM 10914]
MELTNYSFYYGNTVGEEAVGAIAYHPAHKALHGSLVHDFDVHLVVVYEGLPDEPPIQHTIVGGERCQVLSIGMDELQFELLRGTHKVLIKCFLEGEIITDTMERLSVLRRDFLRFAEPIREQKMFIGFAHFLQKYMDAKMLLKEHRVLDAYHTLLEGLKHWAELELIERGIHPESAVWEQITGLNTPVRKLYEELTVSTETLEQRVELALLAYEFSVSSKMESCSALLLRVLRGRRNPWTVQEMIQHPELIAIRTELPIVLRKLVYRNIVHEVPLWKETRPHGSEPLRYTANG